MVIEVDAAKATAVRIETLLGLSKSWAVPVNLLELQVFEKGFIAERFVDNRNDWYHSKDPAPRVRIERGYYLVTAVRDSWTWSARNINFDPRRDFRISCTARMLRGGDDASFGLVWGARDPNHFFALAITANGHAAVTMKTGERVVHFIDPARANANVKKGKTANRLTVTRRGGTVEFRVNDGVVHTMPVRPFFGAGIGFIVDGSVQVAFDDLEVEVD